MHGKSEELRFRLPMKFCLGRVQQEVGLVFLAVGIGQMAEEILTFVIQRVDSERVLL